jgi:hypothetical protein
MSLSTAKSDVLRILPMDAIDSILTDRADEDFFRSLSEIMKALAMEVVLPDEQELVIVEVPRGGSWPSAIVAMMENYAHAKLATVNIGSSRDKEKSLLPDDFPIVDHYVIPDGIMATGTTMQQIVSAIRDLCKVKRGADFEPHFTLLCPVIYQHQDMSNNTLLAWIEAEKGRGNQPNVEILTSRLEIEGQYVKFSAAGAQLCQPGEAGAVLVVGDVEVDASGNVTKIEIGDYGGMGQQGLENDILLRVINT